MPGCEKMAGSGTLDLNAKVATISLTYYPCFKDGSNTTSDCTVCGPASLSVTKDGKIFKFESNGQHPGWSSAACPGQGSGGGGGNGACKFKHGTGSFGGMKPEIEKSSQPKNESAISSSKKLRAVFPMDFNALSSNGTAMTEFKDNVRYRSLQRTCAE